MANNSSGKLDNSDFPKGISQPALRALVGAGITKLTDLTRYTEPEISHLHGMGPSGMVRLKAALTENGMAFADKKFGK